MASPDFNLERTLVLARQASKANVAVALFPELGLSAYTNEDLFHQDALLDASQAAVARLVKASKGLAPVLVVGAPLRLEAKLFNCAVIIYRGRMLGLAPKTLSAQLQRVSCRSGSLPPAATRWAGRCAVPRRAGAVRQRPEFEAANLLSLENR